MAKHPEALLNILKRVGKQNGYSDFNVEVNPITSGGANFTSQLYLATISDGRNKELKLFAKVSTISDEVRAQGFDSLFDIESFVYGKLSKVFQQLEDKYNVPLKHKLKFPKFYSYNPTVGEEILILEDLTAQGYVMYNRFKSIDWLYASKAVEELAKLHALSFAYEREYSGEYAKVTKKLKCGFQNEEKLQSAWSSVANVAMDAAEGQNKEWLENTFKNIDSSKILKLQKPLRRSVLAHWDYKLGNILHKMDENNNVEIKIVDYQTMHEGSPVIDLFHFIFNCSDEEFRKKHYRNLLDHYYLQLEYAMKRFGLQPEETYSKDDFEYELKEKMLYGLATAVFTLPLVTVEEKHAPQVENAKEISVLNVKNTNPLYIQRINGIINDYIRWHSS